MPLTVVPTPIGNLEDITLRALARPARGRPHSLRGHQADGTPARPLRDKAGPHRLPRTQRGAPGVRARRTGEDRAHRTRYRRRHPARLRPRLQTRARLHRGRCRDRSPPWTLGPHHGPRHLGTARGHRRLRRLPAAQGKRAYTELLERIATEPSTFVLFESPHRLGKTLGDLPDQTPVAVCRELTKLHEEVFRGTADEAREHFSGAVKGEIVLVVRGGAAKTVESLEDVVRRARDYVAEGESPSRAAARAARESGRRRGEVYERLVKG